MAETTIRPFTAASFNQYLAEHRLMATRCTACGALHLPPRAICPHCHGDQMEWAETSGRGTLAAFTAIYVAPSALAAAGYTRENPYACGVVELEEGVKISARIVGVDPKNPGSIQIGTPLEVDFIEQGEDDAARTYLAFKA